MTTGTSNAADEAQIRKLVDKLANAVRAKDINGLMSSYAPHVVSFDVLDPLQFDGSETVRKRAEKWFSIYEGPIGYEIRDLSITAGDDVAFCHYLYRVSGTMKDGRAVDMWVRATLCCGKADDTWLVTHVHMSEPFDGESGKASVDLKP